MSFTPKAPFLGLTVDYGRNDENILVIPDNRRLDVLYLLFYS
jgi:hypothetical protein